MRVMCGVQFKNRKISKDLMLMLGLIGHGKQCSLVWSSDEERGR